MKKDLLHTPEGVRDIYSTECVEKKIIENKLHDVCRLYGRDCRVRLTPLFLIRRLIL